MQLATPTAGVRATSPTAFWTAAAASVVCRMVLMFCQPSGKLMKDWGTTFATTTATDFGMRFRVILRLPRRGIGSAACRRRADSRVALRRTGAFETIKKQTDSARQNRPNWRRMESIARTRKQCAILVYALNRHIYFFDSAKKLTIRNFLALNQNAKRLLFCHPCIVKCLPCAFIWLHTATKIKLNNGVF